MSKLDWFCAGCDASFRWLVWVNDDEFGVEQHLKKPESEKEWQEAELFTDFCMNRGEYYPVGEDGSEIDQELCKDCLKKVKSLTKKKPEQGGEKQAVEKQG